MKKSIDEIVNNENYTRLNEALRDRSIEIAKIVRNEMYKLDIIEIGDYKIIEVKSNGFYNEYLGMIKEGNGNEYVSLEDKKSYYFAGDYNRWIEAAKAQDRIQFLNAAKDIFEEIDKIKENRCKSIEFLLNETSDIQ